MHVNELSTYIGALGLSRLKRFSCYILKKLLQNFFNKINYIQIKRPEKKEQLIEAINAAQKSTSVMRS